MRPRTWLVSLAVVCSHQLAAQPAKISQVRQDLLDPFHGAAAE
jgi:hypothetical protein